MRRKFYLILGIIWFIFLGFSYTISLETESGENYKIIDTLLGTIVFHNPVILGIYIIAGAFLLAIGGGVRFKLLRNLNEKH